jgi:putative transposase
MIHRAYRYRLYPDHKQEAYLCQNIGCKRFVWNKLVENFNSWSPEFSPPRINEKILKDNPEYTFLKDAASVVLQQTHRDFLELKKQFFNKKRKTKIGRPRFKKKGVGVESIRFSNFSIGLSDFTKLASGLKLPKLDKPIKIILDREFTGRPLSVTVSVTPTGK